MKRAGGIRQSLALAWERRHPCRRNRRSGTTPAGMPALPEQLQPQPVVNAPNRGRGLGCLGFLILTLLSASLARAHVGSPDVFFDGLIGPYPARITIRMPGVVPGRAEISARVQAQAPVEVSFLPLYAETPVTNAPPADPGLPVPGETNLYSGELWLMSFGAYGIQVRVRGANGEGAVQIPVNSVATRQLALPSWLGKLLLALGATLFLGGIGIVAAAARDSALAPGVLPGKIEGRKRLLAATVTLVIFVGALAGGKTWWGFEETNFRRHLREGAWPDLAVSVRGANSQRILQLTLGKKAFRPNDSIRLVPDHGKLLHVFLVREPDLDAFAHVHPVRVPHSEFGGNTFEAALPPLPEGNYKIFCDLTFEDSGLSSTATNSVRIPALTGATAKEGLALEPDPDDSWASYSLEAVPAASGANAAFHLAGGPAVIWKSAWPLRAKQDAGLQFELRDSAGEPLSLEPYMGMMSHAAVLRADGAVFAHLHPSGNYSMAAQQLFDARVQRETQTPGEPPSAVPAMDHSAMGHAMHYPHSNSGGVSIPYEFPVPGDYRVWVQFKSDGKVLTGVFDAKVVAE